MTTIVRQVIEDAFAEIGDIQAGQSIDGDQAALGLRRYNALLGDLAGMGVGETLQDVDLARYPNAWTYPYTPVNVRMLVGAQSSRQLAFPYEPQNGSRFAIVDLDNSFASSPVTLSRNGRKIDGEAADLLCDTAGYNAEWFYRADLGGWLTVQEAEIGDNCLYADNCRDALALVLSARLSPSTGLGVSAEAASAITRGLGTLKARHRQKIVAWAESAILRTGRQSFAQCGNYPRGAC